MLRKIALLLAAAVAHAGTRPEAWRDGFALAVADPAMHAVHRSMLGGPRRLRPTIRQARQAVLDRIVEAGPSSADAKTRRLILNDSALFEEVHLRVWRCDDDDVAERWGLAV